MVPKLRRNQGLSRFATPRQPRRDQRERRSGATNSSRWSRMIRPIETKLSQSSCPTRRSCVRCGSRWRRRASVQKVARAAQRPAHRAVRRARRQLETRVAEVVSSFCADPVGRDLRDHRLAMRRALPCYRARRGGGGEDGGIGPVHRRRTPTTGNAKTHSTPSRCDDVEHK